MNGRRGWWRWRDRGVEAVSWLCLMSIFLWMCEKNEMHLLTVKELEMVSLGLFI